jgi:lysophospholipase L1-like esterase
MPLPFLIGSGRAVMWRRRRGRLPVPTNRLIEGVGDSITAASHNTAGAGITTNSAFAPRITTGVNGGYLTWAALLPKTGDSAGDGRFQFQGVHATSAMTAASVLTTHVDGADSPLNSVPKPGIVVVLAGANDIAPIKTTPSLITAYEATMADIYDTLIAGGILPVACTITPTTLAADTATIVAINAVITNLAAARGLVLADLYTATNTGGVWTTNYNVDGAHPSVLGAKVMGQTLRDAIDPVLYATPPNLVTAATDGDADLMWENGAMERAGTPTTLPAGGGQGAESATYFSLTAAGATSALGARSPFDGQALTIDKATDSGQTTLIGSGAGNFITLVNGHTYDIGFRGEIESWSGTDTYWNMSICTKITGSNRPLDLTLRLDATYAAAIPPFIMFRQFKCDDAGNFPSGAYRPNITWGHAAGSPTNNLIKTHTGQWTIRDLGII